MNVEYNYANSSLLADDERQSEYVFADNDWASIVELDLNSGFCPIVPGIIKTSLIREGKTLFKITSRFHETDTLFNCFLSAAKKDLGQK